MLLWSLSLIFNYKGRIRRYCSETPLAFLGQKLLKLLTVGYALPQMPLSVGSKLELL